jgi:hypothetical protein
MLILLPNASYNAIRVGRAQLTNGVNPANWGWENANGNEVSLRQGLLERRTIKSYEKSSLDRVGDIRLEDLAEPKSKARARFKLNRRAGADSSRRV